MICYENRIDQTVKELFEKEDLWLRNGKEPDSGSSLFLQAHKDEITKDAFEKMIDYMKIVDSYFTKKVLLIEKDQLLAVKASASEWAYHDETIEKESIVCIAKLDSADDMFDSDPIEEQSRFIRNIPCQDVHKLYRAERNSGDRWNYSISEQYEYLIEEPFGLKGVWYLRSDYSHSRG